MTATIPEVVRPCPRCGVDHGTLTFTRLTHAITEGCSPPLTYWASCPSTGEPILARWVAGTVPVTVEVDEVTCRRIWRVIEGEGGDA